MRETGTVARSLAIAGLFASMACSGTFNCNSCLGGALDPIPGGFPADAVIEKSAQVRLTRPGMTFFENNFGDLAGAFASAACGGAEDPPCGFGLTCTAGVCVNAMGDTEPVLGFPIEHSVDSSGATICRDDPQNMNRRECFAWMRLEGMALEPRASRPMDPGVVIDATVNARVLTNEIPIRYDPLGMDCLVVVDTAQNGRDFVLEVALREWATGRQLEIAIENLDLMIPDTDITISRDPIHGGIDDLVTCGLGNIGAIKRVIISRMTGSLTDIIDEEIRKLLGWPCNRPGALACPADSHCNRERLCVTDADDTIVPQEFGLEGRVSFEDALPGLAGAGDTKFLVGGPPSADSAGVTVGVLGGMERVPPVPSCVMDLPSLRNRMSYTPPRALPTDPMVDLDFDGTAETSYMVSAGVTQQVMDQVAWTLYSSGLFCASIDSFTIDLINTGSLSVLMPSLRRLTHSDLYDWSVWPARVRIRPGAEPRIRISSGEISNAPADPMVAEPLLAVELDDLDLYFTAFVEDRWIHLASMTANVVLPLGIYVTPAGTFEILIGDVESAITNVRIRDHKILAETPMELKESVPALLALVLPQLTQFLELPFTLPTAAELNGFELDLLGIRGVEDGSGGHDFIGVYMDLGFDPSLAPNLSLAAETVAEVRELRVPYTDRMAITAPGAPARPEVVIDLLGVAPAGHALEHQFRVDGGLWSPFIAGDELVVRSAKLLIQGEHTVEVRARVQGDYKTLDATPTTLDITIDSEPPMLKAWLTAPRGGILVRAMDVVSGDRVRVEVAVDGSWREVTPAEDGFVELPEVEDPSAEITVAATDESGRRAEKRLRAGYDDAPRTMPGALPVEQVEPASCVCTRRSSGAPSFLLLGLAGLLLATRRRR